MRTDDFDYDLPDAAVAQTPLAVRDDARLLRVADLSDHRVRDLPALLQPGDVVVVNSTRVRAARLHARRSTGGAVEILLLGVRTGPDGGRWDALVRPARRIRSGEELAIGSEMIARVESHPADGRVEISLVTSTAEPVEEVIARHGQVPLPPYIHEDLRDAERYQTMFADEVGSAAAPTAGLHFTPRLVAALEASGVAMAEVELRIGLDTFRPVTTEHIEDHAIHSEWCRIGPDAAEAINTAIASGGRVVAIGTTVVRTLEAFAHPHGRIEPGERSTDLYITPGYRFRVVDVLVTNYHVPRSSLLVLVAAFGGDVWREAYRSALERGYRFLSFGDAMLLERAR